MYNYISGKLAKKTPAYIVLEVGGIGYEIRIPLNAQPLSTADGQCKVYTHLYLREGVQWLYGFGSETEKELFLQLISVSGIGPSAALVLLSSLGVPTLARAIDTEDEGTLCQAKGIGTKTAKRLILELKGKLKYTQTQESAALPPESLSASAELRQKKDEALEALLVLGIGKAAAEKSLHAVIKKYGEALSPEEMIKSALSN